MRRKVSIQTLTLTAALLLPLSGALCFTGGCVVHEKEKIVERPQRTVVVRPTVVERDRTIIERR